ncbi:MAG: hypothetical protein ACKPKO_15310, partial [Candidatus Fonsibacter sp.]
LEPSGQFKHGMSALVYGCIWESRVMVSPSVHQGDVMLMQLVLQPVQVLPVHTPLDGALVVLVVAPDTMHHIIQQF